MEESTSESSDETSETSVWSSRLNGFQKPPKWWLSYILAFSANATATGLLFPFDSQKLQNTSCSPADKLFFLCMMLAAFGASCVAAFLYNRIRASSHAGWAFGYAVVNSLQSAFCGISFLNTDDCNRGVIIYGHGLRLYWIVAVDCIRTVLYGAVLIWMQVLIAARLDLLEQSSQMNYCSACIWKIIWVQVFNFVVNALLACAFAAQRLSDSFVYAPTAVLPASLSLTSLLSWLCNMVASMVAIFALTYSYLQLRRVLHAARLDGASVAVRSSLRQARRLAAVQVIGVSSSLVFTILAFAALSISLFQLNTSGMLPSVEAYILVSIQAVDFLGNAVAVLLLSGSHRLPADSHSGDVQPSQVSQCMSCCRHESESLEPHSNEAAWGPEWRAKVEELSLRGMTLRSLLEFFREDLRRMPGGYTPKVHRTRDVVRQVIIPLTSEEECAYAASRLNRDGARRAEVMVTHNWGNNFRDLLAAVISDALQECSFNLAAKLLEEDDDLLSEMLQKSARLDDSYWICAFAVNQHTSICHHNPYDRDPFTNELYPECKCKSINVGDPGGRSAASEINKFDDMMHHLAATGSCRQVIAVDQHLELFNRAWCVAEIAEARRLQMKQSLKLASKATLHQRAGTLKNLDVRSMRASSDMDKKIILDKIKSSTNIDQFNEELQALIFDPRSGLLASWNAMDSLQQIGEVGRLIRWGLADAGTGKVWKAWELQA